MKEGLPQDGQKSREAATEGTEAMEAAEEKAEEFADRGAPGVVVQDGAKWRVFIASYATEEDAAAVRRRLGENQRVETYLFPWRCEELRLRLSGMVGQLDLVEAGWGLFMAAAERLRDTATLLDAAQLTGEEALNAVGEINESIVLWRQTVKERFGRQTPELVSSLTQMAEAWQGKYQAIRNGAATITGLSAELKAHAMGLYDEIVCLRSRIAAS